jgi:hypothetical protein
MRIAIRIAARFGNSDPIQDKAPRPRKKKPTGAAAIPVFEGEEEPTQTTAVVETPEGKVVPQPAVKVGPGTKQCPHCEAAIGARAATCPECKEPIQPKAKPVKKAGSPKAESNGTATTETVVALIRAATAYGSLDEAIELLEAIKAAK